MFNRMISNIRYCLGTRDFINSHKNLSASGDRCTMYNIDQDGWAVSCFTSDPKHVSKITEALASIINEVEGDNG